LEKWRKYGESLKSTFSYTTVGLELGLSVALGYLLGDFLDSHFGTAPWLMSACVILGASAGFLNLYRNLKKLTRNQDDGK